MTVYTFAEASRNLAALLEKARAEGEIIIKRDDGQIFLVRPVAESGSPLDIMGIDLGLSAEEIVRVVRESRERP
jgi:hypothetical protein